MADLYTIQDTLDNILFEIRRGGGTTSAGNSSNNNTSSGGGTGNKIADEVNKWTNALAGGAKAVTSIYLKSLEKEQNIWLQQQKVYAKTLETGKGIFERNMSAFGKGMQGALNSTFSSILQGVTDGAYAAASNSIDYATEAMKTSFKDFSARAALGFFKATTEAETKLRNKQLTYEQLSAGANAVGSVASAFTGPWAVFAGAISNIASNIIDITKEIDVTTDKIELDKLKMKTQIEQQKIDTINDLMSQVLDFTSSFGKATLDYSKSIEKVVQTTDESAKQIANITGMSAANSKQYEDFMFKTLKNLSFQNSEGKTTYLNEDSKSLLQAQKLYNEATTRNQVMSSEEFIKNSMLGTVLGDKNLASTLLGDMDYFNKSIETGTDLIFEMFKEANKAGVSNKKFAKDLQQNLKLAQKYTFKGGIKGMMEMSLWAQKTRFNMQGLESIVDKVQDGGLEGVITQAAKLQVLGGHMAMGSDPIAMMYEAWSDPESLAKRFSDMTKGIGHFNSKTGEVDIKGADAMMLKQYAEATGINYNDARAQITQRIKGEQIDKQLRNKYTDQQKALIYNKAKLNENGDWVVTLDNGQTKGINELEESDWNSLMPTEESIEDYVSKIYSILAGEGGAKNKQQADLADATKDTFFEEFAKRIGLTLSSTQGNRGETLVEMIKTGAQEATTLMDLELQRFEDMKGKFKDIFDIINKNVMEATNKFSESGSIFNTLIEASLNRIDSDTLLQRIYGTGAEQTVAKKEKSEIEQIEENIKRLETEAKKDGSLNLDRRFKLKQAHADLYLANASKDWDEGNYGSSIWNWVKGTFIDSGRSGARLAGQKTQQINDGIITNDGLVQSDPKDVAIFAKEGGPIGKFLNDLTTDVHTALGNGGMNGGKINIELSGKLELSSGGQTINILEEMRKNPLFVRNLTQLLAENLSQAKNGGRGKSITSRLV